MKITKEQLKQMIKEEIVEVFKEVRTDRFIRAGADSASHPYAENPPTMPPQSLNFEPTCEDLERQYAENVGRDGGDGPIQAKRARELGEQKQCEWVMDLS